MIRGCLVFDGFGFGMDEGKARRGEGRRRGGGKGDLGGGRGGKYRTDVVEIWTRGAFC